MLKLRSKRRPIDSSIWKLAVSVLNCWPPKHDKVFHNDSFDETWRQRFNLDCRRPERQTLKYTDVTKYTKIHKDHSPSANITQSRLQASGEAKAAKNLRAAGEVNNIFDFVFWRGGEQQCNLYFREEVNTLFCILERGEQHCILYFECLLCVNVLHMSMTMIPKPNLASYILKAGFRGFP